MKYYPKTKRWAGLLMTFAGMMSLVAQDPEIKPFIDDTQPGWRALGAEDFADVNSASDTWSWKEGVLHCTGQPLSVLRTTQTYENFEMVVEWSHQKPAVTQGSSSGSPRSPSSV